MQGSQTLDLYPQSTNTSLYELQIFLVLFQMTLRQLTYPTPESHDYLQDNSATI